MLGNQDRHPQNWGFKIPELHSKGPVLFAPIFDTARGCFWNTDDTKLRTRYLTAEPNRQGYLVAWRRYLKSSSPLISWEGGDYNHFELVAKILEQQPELKDVLSSVLAKCTPGRMNDVVLEYGQPWLKGLRCAAIVQCLAFRHRILRRIVEGGSCEPRDEDVIWTG